MLETKVVHYLKVYFKDFCQQIGHFLIDEIVACQWEFTQVILWIDAFRTKNL